MARVGIVLLLGLCAGGVAGCADRSASTGREPPASASASSAQRQPVDASLIAFLSKARSAHHQADLSESKDDIAGAIRFVEAIPNGAQPKSGPEVTEVLADAHARLGDLKSRDGRFDDAARDIDRGLGLAKDTSHFRGHLFEMRGVIEERRMEALEKAGDKPGAEKAKQAALAAFEQAVEIQDAVIAKALQEPAPAPGSGAPATSGSAPSGR